MTLTSEKFLRPYSIAASNLVCWLFVRVKCATVELGVDLTLNLGTVTFTLKLVQTLSQQVLWVAAANLVCRVFVSSRDATSGLAVNLPLYLGTVTLTFEKIARALSHQV